MEKIETHPLLLKKQLPARTLRTWREAHDLSLNQLGAELGYSRSYIKHLETGRFRASQKFIAKFETLQAQLQDAPALPLPTTISSKYKLPAGETVLLLARPRKCPGCQQWVVLPYAHQRYCDDNCKRLARKPRRKET